MSAFSAPSAPVSDGGAAVFDVNDAQAGNAISHVAGSADVTISQPGTYYAQYAASVAPAGTTALPATNIVTFSLNGQTINAGAGTAQFTATGQTEHLTAAAILSVTTVPSTLRVISSGGTFLYSAATLNIFEI